MLEKFWGLSFQRIEGKSAIIKQFFEDPQNILRAKLEDPQKRILNYSCLGQILRTILKTWSSISKSFEDWVLGAVGGQNLRFEAQTITKRDLNLMRDRPEWALGDNLFAYCELELEKYGEILVTNLKLILPGGKMTEENCHQKNAPYEQRHVYAKKARTEMRNFCLKHYKMRFKLVKRDRIKNPRHGQHPERDQNEIRICIIWLGRHVCRTKLPPKHF